MHASAYPVFRWPQLLLLLLAPLLLSIACSDGNNQNVRRSPYDLVATPDTLDFGVVALGSQADQLVHFQNLGGGSANVGNITLGGAAGSNFNLPEGWAGEIIGGGSQEFNVRFAPQEEGFFEETLIVSLIETDSSEVLEIPLRGQAVTTALRAYPEFIDFGPVAVDDEEEVNLWLENLTSVEILIEGTDLAGQDDYFSIRQPIEFSGFPWTIAAGGQLEITLAFEPESDASQEADLSFRGPDQVDWGLQIEVQGNRCENSAHPGWDADGDGLTACWGDCDDDDATTYPGAPEQPDNVDNDCDEVIDEGTVVYDDDGDGMTEMDGDCDDTNPDTHAAAEEIADGQDNDCDDDVDEGTTADDSDGDGYTTPAGDCDDTDDTVWPGAEELEDSLDNDCDGLIDEDTTVFDDDGDGYCEAVSACFGTAVPGDCNDGDAAVNPAATEVQNGIDDNCDGIVDDGTAGQDDDGDGYTEAGGDCDDGDATVYPNAPELPDGIDNNCDTVIDDGTTAWDDDGDCYCETSPCQGTAEATCTTLLDGDCNDADILIYPGAPEDGYATSVGLGDGIDNDCDTTVDEGTDSYDDDGDGFSEIGGDCNDDPAANGSDYSPAVWDMPGDGEDWDCDGAD